MKTRAFKPLRRFDRHPAGLRQALNRSELQCNPEDPSFPSWKELEAWLLWAGISPKAQEPMSHIGIYTDFT